MLVCELLRANLYEFQKYNLGSGEPPYFTPPRIQSIARQVGRDGAGAGAVGVRGGLTSATSRCCRSFANALRMRLRFCCRRPWPRRPAPTSRQLSLSTPAPTPPTLTPTYF